MRKGSERTYVSSDGRFRQHVIPAFNCSICKAMYPCPAVVSSLDPLRLKDFFDVYGLVCPTCHKKDSNA